MQDPAALITVASTAVAGLGITSAAGLKAWNGWLEMKRMELGRTGPPDRSPPSVAARIEVADLKERVRKLEAIASGVDF